MARLTTHVLDTAAGRPAAGIAIRLYRVGAVRALVSQAETNEDGRTDAPLLDAASFDAGTYELEFDVAPYFAGQPVATDEPPFLDTVVIRVSLAAGGNYHVPLLVSPWSYATYRGS